MIYDSFPTCAAETYRLGFDLAIAKLDTMQAAKSGSGGAVICRAMDAVLGLWLLGAADAARRRPARPPRGAGRGRRRDAGDRPRHPAPSGRRHPHGIPASHWWWSLPTGDPADEPDH